MPFQILYETQSTNENYHNAIDIVAVHGLLEGGKGCWKDEHSGKTWLKDILPPNVPVRRVLSFDFTVNIGILVGEDAANNILQTSHTLVADLEAHRNLSDTVERPLIFVCHDLGGIIVKKALAYSATQISKKVEHRYSIYLSTYAILFFGTPHLGYTTSAWQWMMREFPTAREVPSNLSTVVARFDETLQNITDEFAPIVKQYIIYFFWESRPSQLGSATAYVVAQDSAAPVWDRTERCGIDASHWQMCKFSNHSSPGFVTVLAALRRYASGCHAIVTRRWRIATKYLETQRSIEARELVGFDIHDANKPYTYLNSPKYERQPKVENKYYYVPHNVSAIYTGWDAVTKQLQQSLLTPQSPLSQRKRRIFVLWGLGGAGKTQFCLKFVHDYRQKFWAIFWLDASRTENAERELSEIGKLGGLGNTHQAGIYWLTGLSMPWLLVIDNADDPEVDYAKYFPDSETGHIIVTSRLRACKAHATVGSHEFRHMSQTDAESLLLRAAGLNSTASKADRQSAQHIASKLGRLPLALTQAGASIRQNICTIQEYLDLYDNHKLEMLNDQLVQSTDQYEHTVYTTWEVSVRRIQKTKTRVASDAMDILHTMAFLHFEQVPVGLFFQAWLHNRSPSDVTSGPQMRSSTIVTELTGIFNYVLEPVRAAVGHSAKDRSSGVPDMLDKSNQWDTLRFRRALSTLEGHSLIYLDLDEQSYSMHPMVHLWSRERLSSEEKQSWSDYAVNILTIAITSTASKDNRAFRRALIPHIDACIRYQYQSATFLIHQDRPTLAKAMRFSTVYAENGEWRKAEGLQRRVIKAREQELGLAHADTLDAMAHLADGCWNLFNIGEALALYKTIAEHGSKAYGFDDRRSLKVIDNMAKTLWLAGQTSEALRWSERATVAMTDKLGEGHPDTLTAVFNLARNHIHQGRPEEGAEKLEFVLAQRRRMLGDSHLDTLSAFAELGIAYYYLRRLGEAEQLLNRVMHERSRILGSHHAYTLWAINDLAKIYTEQGRPLEAEQLLTGILDIVIMTLGAEHIGMLMTKYNLARAYNGQEKWAQGRTTLLELTAIQERKLPPLHPDRLFSRLELARARRHLGEVGQAEISLRGLIEEMRKVLGDHHPQTKRAVGQLSAICIDTGKLEEAEELDRTLSRMGTGLISGENTVVSATGVAEGMEVLNDETMQRIKRKKHVSTW